MWTISEKGFNLDTNRHFEGAMCTGSGYMSVRASLEEGLSDDYQGEDYLRMPANVTLEKHRDGKSKWGTYVPGVMAKHPTLDEEIVNLPCFLGIKVFFDDERLDIENCDVDDITRELNMKNGVITRTLKWNTKSGAVVEIKFERFLSRAQKHVSVQQMWATVKAGSGTLKVEAGIDANVRTNGYNHFVSTEKYEDGVNVGISVTTNRGDEVFEVCRNYSDKISKFETVNYDNYIALSGKAALSEGETLTFRKLTVVTADRDLGETGSVRDRALNILKAENLKSYDQQYSENASVWEKKWNISDIVIDGDADAQMAARFAVYHLMRSNCEEDPRIAICAKGTAGDAYFGRFFWDTEIFLLPFFLLTNPAAAKSLLMFRYNTLEGAKKNSENYGYIGARYPWESSTSGLEQCPNFQYGDHEVHVTADIAYALCNYYEITGDKEFFLNEGLDILIETAKYWTRRVDFNKVTGEYNLTGVMGPDEYLAMTRNSAFTNRMVKNNLSKALYALNMLKEENPEAYRKKYKEHGLNEEMLKEFEVIGSKLPIFRDEKTGLVLECEEFMSYADLDFDEIWKDRSKPFGLYISQERNYRSKALKQADVLEMMRLYPDEFDDGDVKKAYDYYEPITTHDSSLSSATHGIIACRLGLDDEAIKFFKKTLFIDLSLEKKGAQDGIHIANCGGIWQLLVFGFAGLRIKGGKIALNPRLPKTWKSMRFGFTYGGDIYRVYIEKEKYRLEKAEER